MANLLGVWEFNGNGWPGDLVIQNQEDPENLAVYVKFRDRDGGEQLVGWWKEGIRQITLIRQLPNNVTQTYIGYIGDNRPDLPLIFGGSFTESDAGNLQFGWYAQWRSALP